MLLPLMLPQRQGCFAEVLDKSKQHKPVYRQKGKNMDDCLYEDLRREDSSRFSELDREEQEREAERQREQSQFELERERQRERDFSDNSIGLVAAQFDMEANRY